MVSSIYPTQTDLERDSDEKVMKILERRISLRDSSRARTRRRIVRLRILRARNGKGEEVKGQS